MVPKRDITRTLAEGTVRMHMKTYNSDPKRTIRRLIDTGYRLSHSYVQKEILLQIGGLFQKENSAYYTAVDKELKNVDNEKLLHFGLNLALNSWRRGAHRIHLHERLTGKEMPWILNLKLTGENAGQYTEEYMDKLIEHFEAQGIYAYHVECMPEAVNQLPEIWKAIHSHQECDFLIKLPDVELKETFLLALENLKNVLLGVSMEGEHVDALCESLLAHRLFYARTKSLSAEDLSVPVTEMKALLKRMTSCLENKGTSILLLRTDEGVSNLTMQKFFNQVMDFRKNCKTPVLLVSYHNDCQKINRILLGENVSTDINSYLPIE